MGDFSKSRLPEPSKKQDAGTIQGSKPTAQLKDNRAEHAAQLKFASLANSGKGNEAVQRAGLEEEEIQMKGKEEEELQLKAAEAPADPVSIPVQRAENKTGLPDQLKTGVENLSGYRLDDVRVHYNSDKPSQLQAHAYAQGSDIHVAPGQEKHLPHEAWHVVQQKQGRVKATRQLKGKVNINDDAGLETEADVMGARALQMKETDRDLQSSNVASEVAQRTEETDMTDSRMNALVNRVLAILGALSAQGEDWERTYGDKGKNLGNQSVEKAKGLLSGSKEKEGPSLKEKVVKEGLKRWWGSLEPGEKLDLLKESTSLFSLSWLGGSSGEQQDEPEKSKPEGSKKPSTKEAKFESDLKSLDLKTLYKTYQGYGEIKDQIERFEKGVKGLAEDLGGDLGAKVGEFRNEQEFESKFQEQQVPFKVARLEFAFLKESISDLSRYKSEIEALENALEPSVQKPSAMISNPSRFTGNRTLMANAVETCSIAYTDLKMANIVRNGTTSLLSNLGIGVDKLVKGGKELVHKVGGFFGFSGEQEVGQGIKQKQDDLVGEIQTVCNKGWYWHTSGIFASKPKGVTEIGEKLSGNAPSLEKLTEIRAHLTQPEEELVQTESKISSTDEEISRLTGSLQKDVTIDNVLSETRSQKSTENYGGKQLDNSSKLATAGAKKLKLELKKKELKKKIKGDGRKPLTQVFYNAIKELQPDSAISLGKTIAIMKQIGAELDETTSHSKGL